MDSAINHPTSLAHLKLSGPSSYYFVENTKIYDKVRCKWYVYSSYYFVENTKIYDKVIGVSGAYIRCTYGRTTLQESVNLSLYMKCSGGLQVINWTNLTE